MLDNNNSNTPFELMAPMGRALSSPQRLRLLHLLAQGERSVEDLAAVMDEPIGITSHHLLHLHKVRLVSSRKDGRFVLYSLADESVRAFWLLYRNFTETRLAELQLLKQLLAATRASNGSMDLNTLQQSLDKNKVVLLDVRPEKEYQSGHIPGAVSAPVDELMQKVGKIPKGKTLVLCCRGPYCLLAFKAQKCLSEQGIHALCLSEGPIEWAAAGLPLESETNVKDLRVRRGKTKPNK